MKTQAPKTSELAAVAAFESLISAQGEAQARLINLQTACQTFFKKDLRNARPRQQRVYNEKHEQRTT